MMDIEYRRDMNHNYMIVKGVGVDVPDDYETRVISTNRIPGLLTCRMQYIDAETWYSYDVTSLQRLTVFCESRKIGKKELVRILSEILRILEGLEDYLLDFQHLILLPSCICMDFETLEISLMYVPFYRKDIRRSLRELTEYLLGCADHSDQSAIVLGYRFCHEVQENNTQLGDLMGVLFSDTAMQPGETAEGCGSVTYAGASVGLFDAGTEREIFAEGMRRTVPFDLSGADGSGPEGDESEYHQGSLRKEGIGKRGMLSVMKRPAVLVVAIALLVFAAVYMVLHTGLLQYVSMYTAGGICAAVCAAVLAVYLIKNRKEHIKDERGDCRSNETERAESGAFYTDNRKDSMTERVENAQFVETEDNLSGPCAAGTGEITEILSPYRAETGPEDRWLLPVSEGFAPRHLNGEDLLIGKQQQYVDMAIDSPTVSRIHARLRFRAGRYFLEDLSSRNGTTLNDEPVCGNEEKVLTEGDVITFSNVAYVFSQSASLPAAE